MDKSNTPALVCRVILISILAAMVIAVLFGCSMLKSERTKTRLSTAIQYAYDNGGCEAVSNKIEELVREGKISGEQAVRLHALAQLAFAGVLDRLGAGEGAASAVGGTQPDGCEACLLPDARSDGASGGVSQAETNGLPPAAQGGASDGSDAASK